MIDTDKLELVMTNILDTNMMNDKKTIIELFRKQLNLLDEIANKFEKCYILVSNINVASKIMQKIWMMTNKEHKLKPIVKSTTRIKEFIKVRQEHIEDALIRLNTPQSLDEIKNISSDIISMQMDTKTNLILADINHSHADRLEVDHNLYTICSPFMLSNTVKIFFDVFDVQDTLDTMNKLVLDESLTKEINVLYPTFVDDFQHTTQELMNQLKYSVDLFKEYKGLSQAIYQIYKKYEILK